MTGETVFSIPIDEFTKAEHDLVLLVDPSVSTNRNPTGSIATT